MAGVYTSLAAKYPLRERKGITKLTEIAKVTEVLPPAVIP